MDVALLPECSLLERLIQRDTETEVDMHCDCRIESPDGRMIRGAGIFDLREEIMRCFLIYRAFLATPMMPG